MSDDKTTLRRLAEATAALLLQRERRTLRALVRAERRTAAMLEHAVRPHIERATISVTHAPGYDKQRVALATIRRTAPSLQRALEGAITEARGYARTAGRDLLAGAFAVASPAPLSGRDEHDAAAAHAAASSWSAAWASAATALVLSDDDPARAAEFSPIVHTARAGVPYFFTWGENDFPRIRRQNIAMVAALRAQGAPVEALEIAGASHFDTNLTAADPRAPWTETALRMIAA